MPSAVEKGKRTASPVNNEALQQRASRRWGGGGSQREWEAPTWVLACVARRPHGGFGKSRLSEGGRSRQMLGFLDAGPFSFPLLVSQRESHREDLEGRDGVGGGFGGQEREER